MMDPFRGELTAKYVHEDDLRWAARERLIRQSSPSRDRDARVPSRRDAKRSWLSFLPALGARRVTLKA